jgi:hypothetical protein
MNTTTTQSTVINLSSRTLTPEEQEVLEFGLNFAIPNKMKKSDLLETALSIECIIHHSKESDLMKDTIRMEIAKEIQKAKKSKKDKIPSPYVPIMKNLRNDSSIVILRADKGNSTVIMNRKDYDTKILSMLNAGPYEIIRQDPTPETVKKVKRIFFNPKTNLKIMKLNV